MATTKLLLILAAVPVQLHVITPPNARPPNEQLRDQTPLERLIPRLTWISKTITCAWVALELVHLTPPTPTFVAGTFLIIAGGTLRALCYRALGPYFTFELAIRPTHALVTQGVYGVVRHPSYTGGLILVMGWLLCLVDYHAWAVNVWGDSGAVTTVMACGGATVMGACCVVVSRRMNNEDVMLEAAFGEEWRAWVKKVPYRLVPGVY